MSISNDLVGKNLFNESQEAQAASKPDTSIVSRVLNADLKLVEGLIRSYELTEGHSDGSSSDSWDKDSWDKGPWDEGHWANRR
jgi:hypothetical protein